MSKYVCSDLHGEYDKFIAMLDLIEFSEDDELYIIGDFLDRGSKPLDILDYIINHKNITLIKGNHEQLYCECCLTGDLTLWYRNGGDTTHNQIIESGTDPEVLYNYLKKLPYIKVVDKFILVHGGLYFPSNYNELSLEEFLDIQEEDNALWSRSHIGNEKKFKDYTIIVGHTPVQTIAVGYNRTKILYREGYTYIDCGCYFGGKLACLRLDDGREFYV